MSELSKAINEPIGPRKAAMFMTMGFEEAAMTVMKLWNEQLRYPRSGTENENRFRDEVHERRKQKEQQMNQSLNRVMIHELNRLKAELNLNQIDDVGRVAVFVRDRDGKVIEQYGIQVNEYRETVAGVDPTAVKIGRQPSVGRTVLYRGMNGTVYPAIIRHLNLEHLHGTLRSVDLVVFHESGPINHELVHEGGQQDGGCWHWPEIK
jgi:hypothetical protein